MLCLTAEIEGRSSESSANYSGSWPTHLIQGNIKCNLFDVISGIDNNSSMKEPLLLITTSTAKVTL